MGTVFKAVNINNGFQVAIKQISSNHFSEGHLKKIQLEIDLLKKLQHENIVQYMFLLKQQFLRVQKQIF